MADEMFQSTMTGKERMMAAMRGDKVDRAPIWLREGIAVLDAPAGSDNFRNCWQNEQLYRELIADIAPYADVIQGWDIPGMNRLIMTDPAAVEENSEQINSDIWRNTTTIHTPRGDLVGITDFHRGEATGWCIKPPVTSRKELNMLQEVPWKFHSSSVDKAVKSYRRALESVGDRGILRLGLSSPIVCISGCMPFELFLELSLIENAWFHELCEEITRRKLVMLDALFATGIKFGGTANLGGSEQCTPPMMRPDAFDEYVVPYDGRLVMRLKKENILVNMHCHGKVRHALNCMVKMGIDSSDPVEPPPAGDCTYAEAREIVGDKLTIVGNLEFDELEYSEPQQIRKHVREILSIGNRRLILSASAGPITKITPRLADNYRAWIDAALEFSHFS
ncbi:MAG: uroporphyrinogen decarboxylase family protein [Victivallaceae bacterium]|nr:uroporphyrinogen decarboxylase family protein [Victivallaceae bacterium]